MQRQPGAAPSPLARLELDVSYDDGATWHSAPVWRLGDRGLTLLVHPAQARFVSLRARARDAAGSAVTQTVVRAYRLGP